MLHAVITAYMINILKSLLSVNAFKYTGASEKILISCKSLFFPVI